MSPVTGWIGGPVDGETPMPVSGLLADMKERGPGDALEIALARSRAADVRQAAAEAADAPDPDERAANLLARGVAPGQIMELGQRLAEVESQLAEENEKIERSERRQERLTREHAAGRLSVWDIMGLPDANEGDAHRAVQLERRAERLRDQLAEAQGRLAPQQQREAADPLAQATSRAHTAFVNATRARMAAAEAGRPAPRPFASGSVSRGGGDRAEVCPEEQEVICPDCLAEGVSWEDSVLVHKQAELDGVALPQRSRRQDSGSVISR